jgi:hypothetical protein
VQHRSRTKSRGQKYGNKRESENAERGAYSRAEDKDVQENLAGFGNDVPIRKAQWHPSDEPKLNVNLHSIKSGRHMAYQDAMSVAGEAQVLHVHVEVLAEGLQLRQERKWVRDGYEGWVCFLIPGGLPDFI